MKLSAMRRIDRHLGPPLCFLLSSGLRAVERLRPRGAPAQGPALFIQLSEMGSPIIAAATIRRVQELFPGQPPCFVILERTAPSLRLLGLIEPQNVFTLPDHSLTALTAATARFTAFCRGRGIGTTIDMELFSRVSSLLSMLSGAPTRVGFDNYLGEGLYRGEHLTHPVNYNPYLHMSQNFMALVESLEGSPGSEPGPKREVPLPGQPVRVPPHSPTLDRLGADLARLTSFAPGTRLVLLNHDAGQLLPIRTWPWERYADLARRLLDHDPDLVVALVGLPDAGASARRIVARVGDPRCVDFTGRTATIEDLVQLFHLGALLVTNDSGPAHFAGLTEVGLITLFGPETPTLYGPVGDRAVNLYKPLACSPCLTAANHRNSPCTDNQCLKAIGVDEVFAAATRLLAEEQGTLRW